MSRKLLVLLGCFVLLFCTACADKQPASENNKEEAKVEEQTEETQISEPVEIKPQTDEPIQLNNTYVTRFSDVNLVGYPKFYFDYPDNWKVTSEEISVSLERVVLSNERGATVVFSHIDIPKGTLGGGSSVTAARVDVSKAGDSQFVPVGVQDNDHRDLGKFMVAKLKVTGQLDIKTQSEYQDVDGKVSYAVLPESWIGTKEDVVRSFEADFAFWYSAYISMTAYSPDEAFTPQEEREVLEILGSFRTE